MEINALFLQAQLQESLIGMENNGRHFPVDDVFATHQLMAQIRMITKIYRLVRFFPYNAKLTLPLYMLNATDQLRFLRFIITAVNINKDTLFVYDTQCHALFSLLKSEKHAPASFEFLPGILFSLEF